MTRVEDILGYSVAAVSPEACVDALVERIAVSEGDAGEVDSAKPFWVACLNPHSVKMALSDLAAKESLMGADILIPDGVGTVLASQILGGAIRKRITGSDIFREISRRLNERGGTSCFFLGSTGQTLAAIESKFTNEFPGIRFAGAYEPPFKKDFSDEETGAMIEAINRAAPDVLWVGMTAPKQEKWIHRNKDKLNVQCIAAVGAVFDFYADNIRRDKDSWFVNHGLEWLPRLLQEPRRLWRRTFVSAPIFFWHVIIQALTSPRHTYTSQGSKK